MSSPLKLPRSESRPVVRTLAEQGILAGVSLGRLYPEAASLADGLVVAVTETSSAEDVEALASMPSKRRLRWHEHEPRRPRDAGNPDEACTGR